MVSTPYLLFVTSNEMQTDTSMEVVVRWTAELHTFGTGRNKTVTIHLRPFIFDIHAGYKSGFREKRRGAHQLVLLLKHYVAILPATE